MMKKLLYFFILFWCVFSFSQTKEEVDKILVSENPSEILAFVKKYPRNPNSVSLVKKYNAIRSANNIKAKPTVAPLNTSKLETQVAKSGTKATPDAKAKRTADILTHLFSNDPSKKDAYVLIKNKSDCNLIVKFEGKNYYNLDVPKKGENFILVPKGTYKLSTLICDAKYTSTKNITEDIEISLDATRKVRK